ncbi:hypothetical protein A5893_05705 [Pedobacter psychrophilus]|uniref:Uncharacterized protein n=1 Tax=Pedobacter psychrophilus TaxID=1826909 RepID=A0A179DJ29_9SPHI|nr:hypothetical protein [Pedobacter psychrophilus]OAQ40443.1 hypothetical protein A5893_05705 [Pedobacter psychrophilus]
MKTSIIQNGISIFNKDYQTFKNGNSKDLNNLMTKNFIDNPENNKIISQILVDLNDKDGGGPIANLKTLEAHFIDDFKKGKVNFAYELKLEWGCSAIKKDLIKHEIFDFELDNEKQLLFLFLFIPS